MLHPCGWILFLQKFPTGKNYHHKNLFYSQHPKGPTNWLKLMLNSNKPTGGKRQVSLSHWLTYLSPAFHLSECSLCYLWDGKLQAYNNQYRFSSYIHMQKHQNNTKSIKPLLCFFTASFALPYRLSSAFLRLHSEFPGDAFISQIGTAKYWSLGEKVWRQIMDMAVAASETFLRFAYAPVPFPVPRWCVGSGTLSTFVSPWFLYYQGFTLHSTAPSSMSVPTAGQSHVLAVCSQQNYKLLNPSYPWSSNIFGWLCRTFSLPWVQTLVSAPILKSPEIRIEAKQGIKGHMENVSTSENESVHQSSTGSQDSWICFLLLGGKSKKQMHYSGFLFQPYLLLIGLQPPSQFFLIDNRVKKNVFPNWSNTFQHINYLFTLTHRALIFSFWEGHVFATISHFCL